MALDDLNPYGIYKTYDNWKSGIVRKAEPEERFVSPHSPETLAKF